MGVWGVQDHVSSVPHPGRRSGPPAPAPIPHVPPLNPPLPPRSILFFPIPARPLSFFPGTSTFLFIRKLTPLIHCNQPPAPPQHPVLPHLGLPGHAAAAHGAHGVRALRHEVLLLGPQHRGHQGGRREGRQGRGPGGWLARASRGQTGQAGLCKKGGLSTKGLGVSVPGMLGRVTGKGVDCGLGMGLGEGEYSQSHCPLHRRC